MHMTDGEIRYEVIFTLDSLASDQPRTTFRWTWVRIGVDGLVTVHGQVHASLREAIDDAAAYRRDHGGGQIRVNIQETQHRDAQDALYLC